MTSNHWPRSRMRTYSPGTPVHGNDLNELQDAIVHHKHGAIEVPIPLGLASNVDGWTHDVDGLVAPFGGGVAMLPLAFPAGTRILEITAWWNLRGHALQAGGAADVLFMYISRRDPFADTTDFVAAAEQIRDATIGDHAGQPVRYTWAIPAPVYLVPGHVHRLAVSLGQRARRLDCVVARTTRS